MPKKTVEEIAEIIFQMTEEFMIEWFKTFKNKPMDKQILAGLHVGFITGMKINGYEEKELQKALKIAQKELSN